MGLINTMSIIIEKRSLDPHWNKAIETCKHATIYHSNEWLSFLQAFLNCEIYIFNIIQNNEIVGYLPGCIFKKCFLKFFGSPFTGWTTPYLGPIFLKKVEQAAIFKAIKMKLKKNHIIYAEFRNQELDYDQLIKISGFAIEKHYTYVTSLCKDEDKLLSQFSKSCKKSIKKAVKSGLKVEFTSNPNFIDIYYEQLEQVFAKHKMKPTYDKKRVELLWKYLHPTGRLLATRVKYNDKIIATRIDMYWKNTMSSFGSASDQNFLKFRPNELARFHVMKFAGNKGIEKYDMTGSGDYKEKFGGIKSEYNILYFGNPLVPKFKNHYKKLKKILNKYSF